METIQLKKTLRAIDLSVAVGKSKKSSRTGFVHLSPQDPTAIDVIPVYENFCYCLALFRQKSLEAVGEGKELLGKLLGFQTQMGGFPVFVHDYPKCWDETLSLKIAPVILFLLRDFSGVLGTGLKEKLEESLAMALRSVKKELSPLWEMRAHACRGEDFSYTPSSSEEWFEWLVSRQLIGASLEGLPYYSALQALVCPGDLQEKEEPRPSPIDWILAEDAGYGARLRKEHPRQLYAALLRPIEQVQNGQDIVRVGENRIVWKGDEGLHSLVIEDGVVFCDLGCSVTIEGVKGSTFYLGQWIEVKGGTKTIRIRFELQEGKGNFLGHISRANRSSQIACKGALLYEAYDWRVAMRLLRSEEPCTLGICLESDELSTAIPIAWSPLST